MFAQTPIEFRPRKDSEVDKHVAKAIRDFQITIPIAWIKDSLYLVGSQRTNLLLKRDKLMIKNGVSFEKFDEFVLQNLQHYQRTLIGYMMRSGESLEFVVDQLINNKKLRGVQRDSYGQNSSPIRSSSPRHSRSPGGMPSPRSYKAISPRASRTSLHNTEGRASTRQLKTRGEEKSADERRYQEQKDKIMNDLREVYERQRTLKKN